MSFYSALFIFFLTLPAQALTRVWLIAPELSSQKVVELVNAQAEIEKILNAGGEKKFSVMVKNVEAGRAVSWGIQAGSVKSDEWPDFIFYYLPARNLARELEEVLLSAQDENGNIISLKKDLDTCKNTPSFLRSLTTAEICNHIGKSFLFKERMAKFKSRFPNRSKEDVYLSASFIGLYQFFLKVVIGSHSKTQSIILISPEHVEYYSDVFDKSDLADSLTLMLLPEVSISRVQFKNHLESGFVEAASYFMLPATFYNLYRPENVIAGSRRELNEIGVKQWVDLIGRYLSDYLKKNEKPVEKIPEKKQKR